ncbi:uncharacterized protein TrAtP1_001001 [Trichoderma atroviride]|uniref:uncharacterized protein n=1 Tax=Hypocrea atroviridis TaxID=63577 RepID=UPI00332767FE|nr:hypothetical protein TrAtP1_001001 [Trichoderma atroviride]
MGLDPPASRRQRIASQHGALQQTDDEMKEACFQNTWSTTIELRCVTGAICELLD